MYNLAIRKCTSSPLLAPRLKIFKLKFTNPPGIESRTCWTRGRHATIWASTASWNICCCVCNKEWLRQERASSLTAARGSRVQVTWLKASTLAEIQMGGHPPYSPDLSPCCYAIFDALKLLWGANDSPRTTTPSSTCGTVSQRSPGNFTRQPFTALCRSGTTARVNTSDIQVLVSVPRPSARFC